MLCFNFVFPITFSYSNGTAVTAANLDGLLDILNNESPSLYLSGVVFPFQVQTGGAIQTIDDEADLIALIISCGLPTFNDDLLHSYCFDIVFPITIGSSGQVVTINSQAELSAYLENNGSEANINFPISVTYNNQLYVLHSIYEFYDMVNNCSENMCVCTLEYAPVCVQTANGIMEFGNMCFAICAGYTQNDLVPCDGNPVCDITNVVVTPGLCNSDGTYELTIDFDSSNTTGQFEVFTSNNNTSMGIFNIASLPVTISNYPYSIAAIPNDNLVIRISANCVATATWIKPNCNGVCICPAVVDPVCVQTAGGLVHFQNECLAMCEGFTQNDFVACNPPATYDFGQLLGSCFFVSYPVNVQFQGALVTVHSNGELLQYWNPAVGPMPPMNYPITVTFANSIFTFANQAAFESQIDISCN